MYLNRPNITLINSVKSRAGALGLTVTQTNSRYAGCFLDAVRVYRSPEDRGRPDRAITTLHNRDDLVRWLAENPEP